MDSLLKAQVHDKLKRGIGYNTTPPPYNNNYIPPKSDLLERHVDEELPKEATQVDPLVEKVEVEVEPERLESSKKRDENPRKTEIPKKDDKEKEKVKRVHYMQTTFVNPCTCQQNKPHQHEKFRRNQRNRNNLFTQRNGVGLKKISKPKPCFICGRTNHLAKQCYFFQSCKPKS